MYVNQNVFPNSGPPLPRFSNQYGGRSRGGHHPAFKMPHVEDFAGYTSPNPKRHDMNMMSNMQGRGFHHPSPDSGMF